MFDARPTKCNICGGKVIFTKMEDVGISPYQSGKCYYCTQCQAFVGTHRKTPQEALGILAHGDTRRLRTMCHQEIDKHWVTTSGKNRAYYRLSKELEIKKEDCHFGHMDKETLERSLSLMREWGSLNFR